MLLDILGRIEYEMRPTAIDNLGLRSVCHAASLCILDWTDRGPAWGQDARGPKEHCILRESQIPPQILLWPLTHQVLASPGQSGSASEDHKSRDYKRPSGRLSFFRSWWRPFVNTFSELEHTNSSFSAFHTLTILSEKKCWRKSVLIRLFFNFNECPRLRPDLSNSNKLSKSTEDFPCITLYRLR